MCRIETSGRVIPAHLEKDARHAIIPRLRNEAFQQTTAKTLTAILRSDGKQQQFFFIKYTATKVKTGCICLWMKHVGSIRSNQPISAISDYQSIANLPAIPRLAVFGWKCPLHHRHDAVNIIERCNHRVNTIVRKALVQAAAGSRASGARP